ncbi:MAG: hypothetical protein JWQ42_2334 [Edaphobacter sp.]|nr:hypothetical protein [Edaphobacter sp.]
MLMAPLASGVMLAARYFSRAALCLSLLFAMLPLAFAQNSAVDSTEVGALPPASTSVDASDVPQILSLSDPLRRWNAGLTITSAHGSSTGWATIAIPAVGYSFNDIFSVDATIPIYMYRLAESRSTHPRLNAQLVNQRGEPGDVILGLHAQFIPRLFQYQATIAVTAPTGDEAYGLTTGRVTFDLNNHFERPFGHFTPNIEIGAGDNTTLVNRILNKNYTSLGPLAHFQVGIGVNLFHGIGFGTDLYEQLPLGDQKIYSAYRKGKPTVVTGYNVTEDNGVINAIDVPIDSHTTLSGYYSRSFRRHTDTAAIGITYVLRGTPRVEEEFFDDLFR